MREVVNLEGLRRPSRFGQEKFIIVPIGRVVPDVFRNFFEGAFVTDDVFVIIALPDFEIQFFDFHCRKGELQFALTNQIPDFSE